MVRRAIVTAIFALSLGWPRAGLAQTTATYHLHKEVSATSSALNQLKTAGPDAASIAIASAELKNTSASEALVKRLGRRDQWHLGASRPRL